MQALPHRYHVTAKGAATGRVALEHAGVPPIESAPPVEFGGPGDAWSPEGLLVAEVEVEGELDRRDGVTAFVGFNLQARLGVDGQVDEAAARAALERAERGCLVSNSLKAPVHLTAEVAVTA